jgi:hypothetical protein
MLLPGSTAQHSALAVEDMKDLGEGKKTEEVIPAISSVRFAAPPQPPLPALGFGGELQTASSPPSRRTPRSSKLVRSQTCRVMRNVTAAGKGLLAGAADSNTATSGGGGFYNCSTDEQLLSVCKAGLRAVVLPRSDNITLVGLHRFASAVAAKQEEGTVGPITVVAKQCVWPMECIEMLSQTVTLDKVRCLVVPPAMPHAQPKTC